jgi:hypothetical protein
LYFLFHFRSQALREKPNEEKSGEKAPPAGFASPTMVVPTLTSIAKEEEREEKTEDEQKMHVDDVDDDDKKKTDEPTPVEV